MTPTVGIFRTVGFNPPVNPRGEVREVRSLLQHYIKRNTELSEQALKRMRFFLEKGNTRSANKQHRIAMNFSLIAENFADTLGWLDLNFNPEKLKAFVKNCK